MTGSCDVDCRGREFCSSSWSTRVKDVRVDEGTISCPARGAANAGFGASKGDDDEVSVLSTTSGIGTPFSDILCSSFVSSVVVYGEGVRKDRYDGEGRVEKGKDGRRKSRNPSELYIAQRHK